MVCPCVGFYSRRSLRSLFLPKQLWLAALFILNGYWKKRSCCTAAVLLGCSVQDLFKTAPNILMYFPSSFFLLAFRTSRTIILIRLPLGRIPALSYQRDQISIWSLAINNGLYLTESLSVDEILLPRYVNWSTYFRRLLFIEELHFLD